MTTVTTRPQYLNAITQVYTAWDLRRTVELAGEGAYSYESFRVLARQAGANLSVDVGVTGVGLMLAHVRGTNRTGQGIYTVDNIDRAAPTADTYLAQLNEVISSNSSGDPRVDQVVLEVLDQQHAGASNLAQIRVVAGAPTTGATLENRSGAAPLPANSIRLADVLVADAAVSITATEIRDRRTFLSTSGIVPPTVVEQEINVDIVAMVPAPASHFKRDAVAGINNDLDKAAALCYLPRRIESATRIRWAYQPGASGGTGNYRLAIYDASGRLIVATASIAITGIANSLQRRSETIAATSFDAGAYYVFFTYDRTLGDISFPGLQPETFTAINQVGPPYPSLFLFEEGLGFAVPNTLNTFSDMGQQTGDTLETVPVPLVALSVG